jgi:hypothetical protein
MKHGFDSRTGYEKQKTTLLRGFFFEETVRASAASVPCAARKEEKFIPAKIALNDFNRRFFRREFPYEVDLLTQNPHTLRLLSFLAPYL